MPGIFGKAVARGAIAFAIVLVVWEVAATLASPLAMPHLGPVLGKLLQLAATTDFWTHAGVSLFRILAGYVPALVVGIPIGLLLRQVPEMKFVFGALFAGLAAVPFVLLAPVTLLWFGFGSGPKIGLAFAAAAFALVGALMTSRDAPRLAAPGGMLPAPTAAEPLAPAVIGAARIAFLVAVGAVLVSEIIGAQSGLGYLVISATSMFDTKTMFAVVLIVALPCALISALLRSIAALVAS